MSKIFNKQNLTNFQKQLKKFNLDGYVVTDNKEQLYLIGFFFSPGEAALLITQKDIYCFTRDLYVLELTNFAPLMHTSAPLNYANSAAQMAKKLNLKSVGFNAARTTYLDGKTFDKAAFKPSEFTVSALREVKTPAEIENMLAACRIASKTAAYMKKFIKEGMTEVSVAAEIERYMKKLGASALSFDSTVCFGVNSNNTHHNPSKTKLKKEMPILLDFGCVYNDYCSDITRSWWFGKKESAEYKKVWNIVDAARAQAIKKAKPGITGQELDAVARDIITAAGYGQYFIHRTGHGIGMQVHEDPNVAPTNPKKMVENNAVTIEPGIYLPGKFGIRLEDTVIITKNGGRALTRE